MSYVLPLLILIAAFGVLLFTFGTIGRYDDRTRKWVGLTLILGMTISWVFEFYTWLIAEAVISFVFFLTYPGIPGRRFRGFALLLGVVFGYLTLVIILSIPIGFALMAIYRVDSVTLTSATIIAYAGSGSALTVAYFLRKRIVYLGRVAFQMMRNAPVRIPV